MHKIVRGLDSSLTMYNDQYKESYHSKSLGAYSESMIKHIFPAMYFLYMGRESSNAIYKDFDKEVEKFYSYLLAKWNLLLDSRYSEFWQGYFPCKIVDSNKTYRILDICFGLGYNAMCALHSFKNCEIYSPELDDIDYLKDFSYSNIVDSKEIIESLVLHASYSNADSRIYFYRGNALDYIESFPNAFFDIILQDPFSKAYNAELWSKKYFKKLYDISAKKCLITTYAKAKGILDNARYAGFNAIKYKYGSLICKG